ncbi:DUF4238 domain-containing protein (plasmid) [Escherichia albertii]|uniref:DUF4238 domain-containing protein n=1 Tax=Escherichia albertii TaxID=208962 RepID=UPI001B1A8252|nr:DUF4238 domain-containing protein [Escherichia albertii]HBA8783493.1 DUF4238 domain-containing protein [Escherichia coli]EGM8835886.1 DUF4238 domain-containing protein [Escherichia albertii]EJZ9666737.1 hypothetical protein [Escherichia albertii]EKB4282242.1 hypothetical protein [Escherichia albertii]MCQ8918739.1 DUF4238 domain-containing protein [Escherichia albertii]
MSHKSTAMSKGSFQIYQHYLPVTYIRQFKITSKDPHIGKDTVYGFVKIDASKKQIKERIVPLNATKICGQKYRHTIYIDDTKNNFIEDLFKTLEDLYPSFVVGMHLFYDRKEYIKGVLCHKNASRNNYFTHKYYPPGNLSNKRFTHLKVYSGLHEIDCNDLKNIAIFMTRFLCYRNKGMDDFFDKNFTPKLRNINIIIRKVLNTNKEFISSGANTIQHQEWKSLLSILKDGGRHLVNTNRKQQREIFSLFRKMHRFIALPFSSINNESGFRAYLFSAPKSSPIISCDFPFIFLKNNFSIIDGCIFTISPYLALIFSCTKLTINTPKHISDLISKKNVTQAKRYIFSTEKERLNLFTKDITPQSKSNSVV